MPLLPSRILILLSLRPDEEVSPTVGAPPSTAHTCRAPSAPVMFPYDGDAHSKREFV